jgi:hypothetical protein
VLVVIGACALIFFGAQLAIWGGLAMAFIVYGMSKGDPSGLVTLMVMGGLALLGVAMVIFGGFLIVRLVVRAARGLPPG